MPPSTFTSFFLATSSGGAALVNSFFISTSALLPQSNIGYTALILAIAGCVNSISLGYRLAQNRWKNRKSFEKGRVMASHHSRSDTGDWESGRLPVSTQHVHPVDQEWTRSRRDLLDQHNGPGCRRHWTSASMGAARDPAWGASRLAQSA
jgi:hypothetical protein